MASLKYINPRSAKVNVGRPTNELDLAAEPFGQPASQIRLVALGFPAAGLPRVERRIGRVRRTNQYPQRLGGVVVGHGRESCQRDRNRSDDSRPDSTKH